MPRYDLSWTPLEEAKIALFLSDHSISAQLAERRRRIAEDPSYEFAVYRENRCATVRNGVLLVDVPGHDPMSRLRRG